MASGRTSDSGRCPTVLEDRSVPRSHDVEKPIWHTQLRVGAILSRIDVHNHLQLRIQVWSGAYEG